MELLCPNCQRNLNIPEQYAGQLMRCPLCNGMFQAPALGGGAPPPPPVYTPPPAPEPFYAGSSAPPPAPAPVAPPPPPGELSMCCTMVINPRVVPWITLVCLIGALGLSFLPWISFMDFRRNAWQIAFGTDRDVVITIYVIVMLLALVLEIPSFLWSTEMVPTPAGLKALDPWRPCIIGGLALVCFVLVGIRHFQPLFSTGNTAGTAWFSMVVRFHFVAALSLGVEYWLERRRLQNLPPPKIEFYR